MRVMELIEELRRCDPDRRVAMRVEVEHHYKKGPPSHEVEELPVRGVECSIGSCENPVLLATDAVVSTEIEL